MGVSSTRVATSFPNTLLGVIPLGYRDSTFPLRNVASVGVNARFSLGRAIIGLIFFIAAFPTLGKNALVGIILLLIGVSLLANAMSAELDIVNNAGGHQRFRVSVFQKSKLEQFREEVNQRLFADQELLRHGESMQVQNQQLYVQQQQLNAQIMQQQAAMQQQLNAQNAQGQPFPQQQGQPFAQPAQPFPPQPLPQQTPPPPAPGQEPPSM
jgi:hypothetical protein